jgi:hypothetical protein
VFPDGRLMYLYGRPPDELIKDIEMAGKNWYFKNLCLKIPY